MYWCCRTVVQALITKEEFLTKLKKIIGAVNFECETNLLVDMNVFPRAEPYDSNKVVVASATEAIQAQERLYLKLKDSKKCGDASVTEKLCKDAGIVLDNLRDIRSQLDGTAVNLEVTSVNEDALQELKQLTLMHVPSSLTNEVKQQFQGILLNIFEGTCKKIIFASLVTNSWYWATQEDRGLQAKHNTIFVVFLSKDEHFFAPANPHNKEQNDVIDKGWFYATEISHFAHYLVKGKARFVETLFADKSVLCKDEDWELMSEMVNKQAVSGQRGFLEQCRGQAVGAVAKKRKSGKLGPKDVATLYEFSESFLLLHQGDRVLSGQAFNTEIINDGNIESSVSAKALKQLKDTYQTEDFSKTDLLQTVLSWKQVIDEKMKGFKFASTRDVEKQVGNWIARIRKGQDFEPKALGVDYGETEKLRELMRKIGGNVEKMAPEQILMIAQAGSYLYGLNTPQSDTDYVVIYAEPTQVIISACKSLKESFEDRGPTKSFEYGSYEVRLFCEMVLKGSVVILELLFADGLDYCSSAWKALTENKHIFLTERGILQYFGLIRNNMVVLKSEKHRNSPRERKLFYQIFYKLHTLEYFLKGQPPPVRCTGESKEFIMKIRRGPLEGEISYDKLYSLAEEKIYEMKDKLASRKDRLPENVNFDFMTKWLMAVRGWTKEDTNLADTAHIDIHLPT